MSDKKYYGTVAGGAAVATGVSILMEVGARLFMYYMDPDTCPELKKEIDDRRWMVAKGFSK